MIATLDIFNFGENFTQRMTILLGIGENSGFQALTVVNGNISRRIDVDRGGGQGDPIVGYLFILAIEILALLLKTSGTKVHTSTGK